LRAVVHDAQELFGINLTSKLLEEVAMSALSADDKKDTIAGC
jgi:hypothetical protein